MEQQKQQWSEAEEISFWKGTAQIEFVVIIFLSFWVLMANDTTMYVKEHRDIKDSAYKRAAINQIEFKKKCVNDTLIKYNEEMGRFGKFKGIYHGRTSD